jgi:hypothetical protein
MASNSTETKPKKVRGIQRFAISVNVLIQILAICFILAGINYYAFKHFKRWDYSRDHKYALADQTKRILESLQKPLKIFIFFSPDPSIPGGEIYPDVQALLQEYQYAANGKIDIETIDPYKSLSRAKELMAHYKFGNENVVIVDYQGHSKLVNATDMADYDTSGEMYGQPVRLKSFRGEQALTGAILEVSEERQNKIYLVGGKGGPELNSDELSVLKTYMERQNLLLDTLTLMNVPAINADAKAIMLIGPKYDLTDREIKLLRDYWDKQGRLYIALDPNAQTPNLDSFLRDVGIVRQDDRVLRTMAMGNMTAIVRDVSATFSPTSPVTKRLEGVDTIFIQPTQSLALVHQGANSQTHTEGIVSAAEGYWGETKYQDVESTGVSYDPKEDISAPLTLAVTAEKGALADASVNVDTSRMIVTGNSDFMGSQAFAQSEANLDFVMAGLNWLINREELIGIAPKDQHTFSLNLTDTQLKQIELLVMVVMPVAVAMLGVLVWAQRRR